LDPDADLLLNALRHAQEVIHRRTGADLAGQLTVLEARFPAWPVVGSARQDPLGVPAVRGFWDALAQRLVLEGLEARLGGHSSGGGSGG